MKKKVPRDYRVTFDIRFRFAGTFNVLPSGVCFHRLTAPTFFSDEACAGGTQMNHFISLLTSAIPELVAFITVLVCAFGTSATGQNCSRTSVGFIPLNDLGGGLYKGYAGGLYPGGSNQRPEVHDSVGIAFAKQVQPLNSVGGVDLVNGKIVLLSIGMSNATQEYSMFKSIADTDRTKNPQVVIVDGAQGGQTAAIISNPSATFWTVIDQRLMQTHVTPQQVQVAWIKEADANPTQPFPTHALTLENEFEAIAKILKSRYPHIKIAYWASRTYGGYATTTLNPEPYAYESGFAVKWLIEKQINGDTTLSYSGTSPKTLWFAWGPYLWADGMNPRSDGMRWECADFQTDGTHPSQSGRTKVAQLLLKFLKTDPTAACWFLKSSATRIGPRDSDFPDTYVLEQNFPNPFNPTTTIRFTVPATARYRDTRLQLKIFDVLGRDVVTLIDGELYPSEHVVVFDASREAKLATGAYVYQLRAGEYVRQKLMVLIK